MKKTLMTIAIAAALTGTAFATQPSGGGSAVMGSVSGAVTGANASTISVGNGGDGAIMWSGAAAGNTATAGYDIGHGDGSSVGTYAETAGYSESLSAGLTWGSGSGFTYGVAGQAGFGAAKACDGSRGCGSSEKVSAESEAGVASLSATAAWGTGLSYQGTVVGAGNASGASADVDKYDSFKWGPRGTWTYTEGEKSATSAGSEGYTYSESLGFSLGAASGLTGGVAYQSGSADAVAKGKLTEAKSSADVGSLSATGVLGTGYGYAGAKTWADNSSEAVSEKTTKGWLIFPTSTSVATGANTSGGAGAISSTTRIGNAAAISVGGASSSGSALAGGATLLVAGNPICPPGPTNPPPKPDKFFEGNPGNDKPVGNAGEDPNGRGESFWETGIRGRGK
jgi:hypothetical protein